MGDVSERPEELRRGAFSCWPSAAVAAEPRLVVLEADDQDDANFP